MLIQDLMVNGRGHLSRLKAALLARGVNRKFATNTGWAVAGQGVAAAVSLAETLLLARFLETSVFGLFLVLLAATELVFGLLDCRSGDAVIKFLPQFQRAGGPTSVGALMRCVILADLTLGLLGFGLVWLLVRHFGGWISVPAGHLDLAVLLAAGFVTKTVMNSAGSYMRVTRAFPLAVQVSMAASVMRVLLCVVVILTGPSLRKVCFAMAGSEALLGLGLLVALLWRMRADGVRLWGRLPGLPGDRVQSVAKFMFHMNLTHIVRGLAKKADVIVIAALSSTGVVALYKTAMRLAGTLLLFSDPLVTVVYPTLSQLHAHRKDAEIRRLTGFLSAVFACAALGLTVGFALFGRSLLGAVLGPQYYAAFSTALIMLAGFSLSMVLFWARPLMLVYGLTFKVLQVGLLAIAVQFTLLFLLVPRVGAVGGAVAVVAYHATVLALYMAALCTKQRKESLEQAAAQASPVEPAKV